MKVYIIIKIYYYKKKISSTILLCAYRKHAYDTIPLQTIFFLPTALNIHETITTTGVHGSVMDDVYAFYYNTVKNIVIMLAVFSVLNK